MPNIIIIFRTPPLLRNYWVGMRHTIIVIGGPCPNLYSRVGVKYPKVTLTAPAPKYDLILLSPLMWSTVSPTVNLPVNQTWRSCYRYIIPNRGIPNNEPLLGMVYN